LPSGKVVPQLVSAWDLGVLLAPDGSLWRWGDWKALQMSRNAGPPTPIQALQRIGSEADWCQVAGEPPLALALKTDGSLWGWGWSTAGMRERVIEPARIGTDLDWSRIAVGAGHWLALKRDGSLWAWGQNDHGQLGDGTTFNRRTITRIGTNEDWVAVAVASFHSFALKRDGTLWEWGLAAGSGEVDDLSPRQIDAQGNVVAISADYRCVVALRSDGTLWIGGEGAPWLASAWVRAPSSRLVQIGKDADWRDVYAGVGRFLARKRDGTWWVCGQCQGAAPNSSLAWTNLAWPRLASPRRLPLRFEPWALAAGSSEAFLLTRDRTLWSLWIGPDCSRTTAALTNLKVRLNRLVGILPGHPQPFDLRGFRLTATPQKIWHVPDEAPLRHVDMPPPPR
jgi:hypothetical protein